MARAYCGTRISPHMIRDVNGFLVCLSAPICRSGFQTYKVSEVDPTMDDDSKIEVLRPVSEVCSPATIASGEGAAITLRHPAKFVTPETYSWTALGHAQNIRIGPKDKDGNAQLIADLHIKDKSLGDAIERGVRDLSCGYTYSLVQLSDGTWAQTDIKINHIAVVEDGRAGTSRIMDSKEKDDDMDGKKLDRLCDLIEKLLPAQDAECTCGGKKQHSDTCPCYGKEAEDDLPGEATGRAIAEGHPGEALENIGEGVSSVVSSAANLAGAAAMADDDDPDGNLNPEYERTGGPQRKSKGFTGLIPITGKGAEGNVNPVAARDALQSLANPSLRAAVKAGGKKMIDAYNKTVRGLQSQIRAGGGRRELATDSLNSSARRRSDADDFEARAAKFHGKAIKLHAAPNAVEDEHRAEDTYRREESFDEAVERVRLEQIERYTPRKRR